MNSYAILERPGPWRSAWVACGLAVAVAPALWLVAGTFAVDEVGATVGVGFPAAMGRGIAMAGFVALVSWLIGLPIGVVAGLYEFPARKSLLLIIALPLLVPPFLGAIGLSMLCTRIGFSLAGSTLGAVSTVFIGCTLGLPLVVLATSTAVRGISRSQADAVRLAGGEGTLFLAVGRQVAPVGVLTALLAGIITLTDPGAGQILGANGPAAEILISFSARYDSALAARQCLLLAGTSLVVALPALLRFAPRVAASLLARDVTPVPRRRRPLVNWLGPVLLAMVVTGVFVIPVSGLILPLGRTFPLGRALGEVGRTLGPTLIYGGGAALVAVAFGTILAVLAGRSPGARIVLTGGSVLLLALPPALGALGFMQLATVSPAWLDLILRSELTVGLCLGLRLMPIAALFALRSFGSTSPSWAEAAALHAVPWWLFTVRVLAPRMASAVGGAALLVGLLAIADVTTTLLLHPPGRASLPLAIFTIMANAPEALVGALCLIYVVLAAVVLGLIVHLVSRKIP